MSEAGGQVRIAEEYLERGNLDAAAAAQRSI